MLFSWKEDKKWNYALSPNLNVTKAFICNANTLTDEDCLKYNLGFLAEEEEVFWETYGTEITSEGKKVNLTYPSTFIVEDIKKYCEEINIKLICFE